MKKAPEAFRTISEVSDLLDTPAHVLRFWESKFYQIRPVKRAGGRRYYRPDDVALLAGIRLLLQDQGMTIRGVQKVLQEQGVRHVAALAPDATVESFDTSEEAQAQNPDRDGAVYSEAANASDAPAPRRSTQSTPELPRPLPPEDADESATPGAVDPQTMSPQFADQHTTPSAPPLPVEPPAPSEPDPVVDTAPPTEITPPVDTIPTDPPPGSGPVAPSAPQPLAPPAPRAPVPPAPDLSDQALALDEALQNARLAQLLRRAPRDSLGAHQGKAALLARRIDALLDRMSDASGVGRW
ncbi:MAG: MerR family transcriptional regulator [Pararhodobacter sp.]|nr:MerR family transcriptional regulator [Pararhodobacter sp.]